MDINGARVTRESKGVHWVVKMEWHFPVVLLPNTNVDLIQNGNGTEKSSRVFLDASVSIKMYIPSLFCCSPKIR